MNRNRGAELLRPVGAVRKIAARLGFKSPSIVHRWLQCTELPSEERQAQIETIWPSVYRASWRELVEAASTAPAAPPPAAPPPAAPPPPMPLPPRPALVAPAAPAAPVAAASERTEINVVQEAEAQVERLRRMQADAQRDDVGAPARVAIERELRLALAHLAELRGELSPSDEERLLESDAWARIQGRVIEVMRGLPEKCTRADVCTALASAFEILDPVLSAPA